MPFVTRFPGFRFRSSLLTSLRWPATPPFQSGVCRQEKSILGFSRGSEICFANLRVANPRLHALFAYWQERIKHACKKIPPWLNIP
ncbi:MAG: hypothetical protein II103_08455, partial [Treponema sp.]|nr:hypothetical protein [Treponema sp.]